MKEKNKNEFHVAIPDEGMKKKNTRNSKIVKSKIHNCVVECKIRKIRIFLQFVQDTVNDRSEILIGNKFGIGIIQEFV